MPVAKRQEMAWEGEEEVVVEAEEEDQGAPRAALLAEAEQEVMQAVPLPPMLALALARALGLGLELELELEPEPETVVTPPCRRGHGVSLQEKLAVPGADRSINKTPPLLEQARTPARLRLRRGQQQPSPANRSLPHPRKAPLLVQSQVPTTW